MIDYFQGNWTFNAVTYTIRAVSLDSGTPPTQCGLLARSSGADKLSGAAAAVPASIGSTAIGLFVSFPSDGSWGRLSGNMVAVLKTPTDTTMAFWDPSFTTKSPVIWTKGP